MPAPDDQPARSSATDPGEERLRGRLRLFAGVTILGLVVVLSLADTFGGPSGLHVSDVIFGSLIGALLLILGVEGAARLVKKP